MLSDSNYDSNKRLQAFLGDMNEQYNLAKYLENIDSKQAMFWYKKSALQGNDLSIDKCNELNIDINASLIDRELIRKDLNCRLYPLGYLKKYKYTVICTIYNGKYILSCHKKRTT